MRENYVRLVEYVEYVGDSCLVVYSCGSELSARTIGFETTMKLACSRRGSFGSATLKGVLERVLSPPPRCLCRTVREAAQTRRDRAGW